MSIKFLKDKYKLIEQTGKYLSIENNKETKAQIALIGSSIQKIRSGKNLVDILLLAKELTNGISYTYENDKIHVEGTATALAPSNIANVTDKLEIGKKYILSLNKSNTDNVIVTASIQYNDGTPQAWVSSFTFAENIQLVNIYLQVANGTTVNTDVTVQLEEGEVSTEYEQYGASPSPEFPSEIENVEGDIDITVCNKNFVKLITEIPKDYITINDNQTFTINGTLNENDSFKFADEIFLKAGKYKASLGIDYTKFNDSYFNISANGQQTKYYNRADTTFEIAVDAIVNLSIVLKVGTYDNLIVKPMIERIEKEITSDWVEQEEQVIVFPLQENQKLCKKDYLANDGVHHVFPILELQGTEIFTEYNSTTYNPLNICAFKLQQTLPKNADTSLALSSHFVLKDLAQNNINPEANKFSYYTDEGRSDNSFYFFINYEELGVQSTDSSEQKIEKFKNWIVQQKTNNTPVMIGYGLSKENEIVEPYTEVQQEAYNQLQNVTLYKDVTNIFSNNTISPSFKVSYEEKTKYFNVNHNINFLSN